MIWRLAFEVWRLAFGPAQRPCLGLLYDPKRRAQRQTPKVTAFAPGYHVIVTFP